MPSSRSLTRPAAVLAIALVAAGCSSITSGTSTPSASADNRQAKQGGTLRVALSAEPDKLDPTLARTLVGRTVFNAICEKLYDVNTKLELVPQLAAALPEFSSDGKTVTVKVRSGVKFADGTMLDADAVKTSLDRHMTLSGSARKSELSSVDSVAVADPSTVTFKLKQPFVPLTAVLADRAGMIMSPAALKALDRVVYRIIADATTRFNNLRSGDVDVLDTVAATDVDALKADSALRLLSSESLGYQGITINLGNVNGVGKPPGLIASPSRRSSGVFASTMLTFTGTVAPASASSLRAAAGSCFGQACAASDVNGLAGLMGPHAGLNCPVWTVWRSPTRPPSPSS